MSTLNNQVLLVGHLGADPEMKVFDNGKKKATISLATSEYHQTKGVWQTETQWHRLVGWNKTAERAGQQLKKGSHVMFQGKLTYRSYELATGEKRFITEIQIQSFRLLSAAKKTEEPVFVDQPVIPVVKEADFPF